MNEWLECDLSELRIQYRDRLADLGFAHRATMMAETDRDAAIARAERAEAALVEHDQPCLWRKTSVLRDDSVVPGGNTESDPPKFWYSACGHVQYTPPSHEWKHCPHCGSIIWVDNPNDPTDLVPESMGVPSEVQP